MDGATAPGGGATRQAHIEPLAAQPFFQRRIGKRGLLGRESTVDLIFQCIQRRSSGLALFGRHLAQLAHFQANFAFFADGLHTQSVSKEASSAASAMAVRILFAQIVHDQVSGDHPGLLALVHQGFKRIANSHPSGLQNPCRDTTMATHRIIATRSERGLHPRTGCAGSRHLNLCGSEPRPTAPHRRQIDARRPRCSGEGCPGASVHGRQEPRSPADAQPG